MLLVFALSLMEGLVTEEEIISYEGEDYLEKVLEKVEELKAKD